ncbi:MAG: MMPL family transporter [Pseudomonadota bacterium]
MRVSLNRKAALCFLAALVLAPGPLLLNLKLNNAPDAYFPTDAAAVVIDRKIREHFPQDQVLVALFSGQRIFEKEFLTDLKSLALSLENSDLVERAMTLGTVDHIRLTDDGFTVEQLLGSDTLSVSPNENSTLARSDRFAPGAIVSRENDAVALVVRPTKLSSSLERYVLQNDVRKLIDTHGLTESLQAIGGHVALDVAQFESMIRDLALFVPGTLAISLALLWWFFGRWEVLVLSTGAISAVTGCTIALLSALGQPFTLIMAILPPLLTALLVAMLLHLYNAIALAESRGMRGIHRMTNALGETARPIFFTALTTAAGLLSLVASPIRPIAYFGLSGAFGILMGALVVLYLLPPLLLEVPLGKNVKTSAGWAAVNRVAALSTKVALRHPLKVLSVSLTLVVWSALYIPSVTVESDLYRFFSESHPISRATEEIESNLSGVMPLELLFSLDERDGIIRSDALAAVAKSRDWLLARPEVDLVVSLPDLLEQMHWAFGGGVGPANQLPQNDALIEQYLLFYDGQDLGDVLNEERNSSRLLASLNVHGAREINRLLDDFAVQLAPHLPSQLNWDTGGMARLFADQEKLLIEGQIRSLVLVLLLIGGAMAFLWRSLALTMISMIPNIAPIVLIFGCMGFLGIWLDMATAMVASVAIGIAVDDTIHLLFAYRSRLKNGAAVVPALVRSMRERGRALLATTAILVGQFLLIANSDFLPTSVFGALTALGLCTALLFDLFTLPAIILLLSKIAKTEQ